MIIRRSTINGYEATFRWHIEDREPITTQCAWCGSVRIGVEYQAGRVPTSHVVSHGICPECRDIVTAGMRHNRGGIDCAPRPEVN